MGVLHHTKYKFKAGYKTVYNCDMPYLMALMITGFEFSKDPKNE